MYQVEKTNFGYTLTNGSEVYVLNKTKNNDANSSSYYFKQVAPISKYICGVFKERGKRERGKRERGKRAFKGKHYNLFRIYITITGDRAYIDFE